MLRASLGARPPGGSASLRDGPPRPRDTRAKGRRRAARVVVVDPRKREGGRMNRRNRSLEGCGLVLVLAASGCQGTRTEGPENRPYNFSSVAAAQPPVQFSS